ncbi:MAG: hypothetical protein ACLQVD_16375 [Capsulimonadaceae bacterium]
MQKELFGLFSALATVIGAVPYIVSTVRGQTRPHLFTWLVWTLLTGIIFFIQVATNAGPGSWAIGLTALTCAINVPLSIRYGESRGTVTDRIALAVSIISVIVWRAMNDPTVSAVMITAIDVVAFYPTVRKTFSKPYEENLFYYVIWLVKYPGSLLASRGR